MKNKNIISEEIGRIREIMGISLNEALSAISGPGGWILRLIDEVEDVMLLAGKSTLEINDIRRGINAARTETELQSEIFRLFRKGSDHYNELINLVRTNYADKIEAAVLDAVNLGKRLKDQGKSIREIEVEMKRMYDEQIKGYMGPDIKEDVIRAAKSEVEAYSTGGKIYTIDDLREIWNAYRNDKNVQRLFNKYGPQLEAQFQSAVDKLSKHKDMQQFVDELDGIIRGWAKDHPYVPNTAWEKFKNLMVKTFIIENRRGGIGLKSGFLWVGWLIMLAWIGRGLQHKYWGETWARAFTISIGEDVAGLLGLGAEAGKDILDEVIPKPDDPITPEDVQKAEEKY